MAEQFKHCIGSRWAISSSQINQLLTCKYLNYINFSLSNIKLWLRWDLVYRGRWLINIRIHCKNISRKIESWLGRLDSLFHIFLGYILIGFYSHYIFNFFIFITDYANMLIMFLYQFNSKLHINIIFIITLVICYLE